MAQRTTVTTTCDVPQDHGPDEPGSMFEFGYAGSEYEIDLCGKHEAVAAEFFGNLVRHARRTGSGMGRRPRSRTKAARAKAAACREWAVMEGLLDDGSRGRIPSAVCARYEAYLRGGK